MFPLKDENPTRKKPIVTYSLIAINVVIFLGTLLAGTFDQSINEFGMRPSEVLAGRQLHTLFTSMFLHGGVLHILFNMLYLWIFADNVEDVLGRGKFLLFYFGTGLAASFAHSLTVSGSQLATVPTIGASGAISGVLAAYALLYPRAKVHTAIVFYFIYLITIPAFAMIGFWFVLQVFTASFTWMSGGSTGTAYMAHIGGFVAGLLLILPVWMKRKRRKQRLQRMPPKLESRPDLPQQLHKRRHSNA